MLKFIHILVVVVLALLQSGRAYASNNAGQAFSLWPDTGQTTCYDANGVVLDPCPVPGQPFYGQDAQYDGPARSYTKLDASGYPLPDSATSWSMVQDNVTGLIWEAKDTKDSVQDYFNPHDADNTYTWCDTNPDTNGGNEGICGTNDTEDFLAALNGSTFGGHSDWRLPTINELATLVDRGRYNPAINPTYFPLTVLLSDYFSSTTSALYSYYEWLVSFLDGNDYDYIEKEYSMLARAVRDDQAQPAENRFVNNQDGTVSDTLTCLQWQQATADIKGDGNPDAMNWQGGLAYAENLILAGKTDWRLPDINELRSIVDYSRGSPAIDTTAFPGTESSASSFYLSSTTSASSPDHGWYVDFSCGENESIHKSESYFVRAVRGEQCKYWVITASAGENGSISPAGALSVLQGSDQSFAITANPNYHVADVLVDGVSAGAATSYTFTNVTAAHTIEAIFTINTYTVTAISSGNGAGTVTSDVGGILYTYPGTSTATACMLNHGSSLTLTATAATGSTVSWSGCSATGGTSASATCTLSNLDANKTVVASFTLNTYTVTPDPGANGSITPSTPQLVDYYDTISFTVTPDNGYRISTVTGCGGSLAGDIFTTGPIAGDCTVSAFFSPGGYAVTPFAGANGSISPSTPQIIKHGLTTTFIVTPDAGYHISSVNGCVGTLTDETYTTGPIVSDCSVTASFAINTYVLTVTLTGKGKGLVTSEPTGISCSDDCCELYERGTLVTLIAMPQGDSIFAGWSGDCTGTDSTCDVTVDQARNVSAEFRAPFPWALIFPVIIYNAHP